MVNLLKVYVPGRNFPSVSVTGRSCHLNCAHCGRHYLRGMVDARRSLKEACLKPGVNGCLISGGLDGRLKVPVDRYRDELMELKREGLKINAHVGFVDESDLEWLRYVDVVSLDFVGDDGVIRRVYGIEKTVRDYLDIMDLLISENIRVAPHVTVGLDFGRIWWEKPALEILSSYEPDVKIVVLDFLIPTKGTVMWRAGVREPSLDESLDVVRYARDTFGGELSVGCMRPRGPWRREFDSRAVEMGIDRITNPPKSVVRRAQEELGKEIKLFKECCVM
ncbi:MAG: radical SAM protein [Thermococci archaeon]|nr:radical SAM protein [Thermococci archaeon]